MIDLSKVPKENILSKKKGAAPPESSGEEIDIGKAQVARYTINAGKDKQYVIEQPQVDYIKSLYKTVAKDYYSPTFEDQTRAQTGKLPLAFESSYGKSNTDADLYSLGLPSLKYLEKYVAKSQEWYGNGETVQLDKPAEDYVKTRFQQDWVYEYTPEDDRRKRAGIMPLAMEEKYGDTYVDYDLKQRGLPSTSMLGEYYGKYETVRYQNALIDNFYTNVAAKYVEAEANGKPLTEEEKVRTLGDMLLQPEYKDLLPLYQEYTDISSVSYDTPMDEYDAKIAERKKANKQTENGSPIVSFDDFNSKYNTHYKSYVLNQRISDDAATTWKDIINQNQQANEDQLLAGAGKESSFLSGSKYSKEYAESRKGDDPVAILADLANAGAGLTQIRAVSKLLNEEYANEPATVKRISDAFFTLKSTVDKKNAEKRREPLISAFNPAFSNEAEALRKDMALDEATTDKVIKPYEEGATSTLSVKDGEKLFREKLEYDAQGVATDESVALAVAVLFQNGVSPSTVKKIGSIVFDTNYAKNVQPYFSFTALVDKADKSARAKILEDAREKVVGAGTMTDWQYDQLMSRAGWGDVIDPAKHAEDYYKEVYAPKFEKNGEHLIPWENLAPQDKADFITSFTEGAPYDPEVHKSTKEILVGQFVGKVLNLPVSVAADAVSFADMITIKGSGRTAQWELTQNLNKISSQLNNFNASDQTVTATVYRGALDVGAQVARMYALSAAGSGVVSMFGAASDGVIAASPIAARLAVAASNASPAVTKGISTVVKAGTRLAQSTPFVATSMGAYYSEAMQGNATVDQAVLYGTVCGALEGFTEAWNTSKWLERGFGSAKIAKSMLSGGKAVFDTTTSAAKGFAGRVLLSQLFASAVGNGIEEMASYVGSTFMQRATYNKGAQFDFVEMIKQGGMGALVGILGSAISSGRNTNTGIIADFLDSKAGQAYLKDANNASAITDLLVNTVLAEEVSPSVKNMIAMGDASLSLEQTNAVMNDIYLADKYINDAKSSYEITLGVLDSKVNSAQNAFDLADAELDAAKAAEAENPTVENMNASSRAYDRKAEAKILLDTAQAKLESHKTEGAASRDNEIAQNRISMQKAQDKLLASSISIASAFRGDIMNLDELVKNGVTTVPNNIGAEIMMKMDAARRGTLAKYMENYAVEREAVRQKQAAAEAETARQQAEATARTQAEQIAKAQEEAKTKLAAEVAVTRGYVEKINERNHMVQEENPLTEAYDYYKHEPFTFSDEELAVIKPALEKVGTYGKNISDQIKKRITYSRKPANIDAAQEELESIALDILSGRDNYTDMEKLTEGVRNALSAVEVDFDPSNEGYENLSGDQVHAIRTDIMKQRFYTTRLNQAKQTYERTFSKTEIQSVFPRIKFTSKHNGGIDFDRYYTDLVSNYPETFSDLSGGDALAAVNKWLQKTSKDYYVPLKDIDNGQLLSDIADAVAYDLFNDVSEAFVNMPKAADPAANPQQGVIDNIMKSIKAYSSNAEMLIKAQFPQMSNATNLDVFQREIDKIVADMLSGGDQYSKPEALVFGVYDALSNIDVGFVATTEGSESLYAYQIKNILDKAKNIRFYLTKNGQNMFSGDALSYARGLVKFTKHSKGGRDFQTFYDGLVERYPLEFQPATGDEALYNFSQFVSKSKNAYYINLEELENGNVISDMAEMISEDLFNEISDGITEIEATKERGNPNVDTRANSNDEGAVADSERGGEETVGFQSADVFAGENGEAGAGTVAGEEATVNENTYNPESEAGAVDLGELQLGTKKFLSKAYKSIFRGTSGFSPFAKKQRQVDSGAATIEDLEQEVRGKVGVANYQVNKFVTTINGDQIALGFKPLLSKVKDADYPDFDTLMYALVGVDRMSLERRGLGKNKPVLGKEMVGIDGTVKTVPMTETECQELADKILAAHPYFKEIYDQYQQTWWSFFYSFGVDGKIVKPEVYDALKRKYPHYIPTFREEEEGLRGVISVAQGAPVPIMIPSAIRVAEGSVKDILDSRLNIATQVQRITGIAINNKPFRNVYGFAQSNPVAAAPYAQIIEEGSRTPREIDTNAEFTLLEKEKLAEASGGKFIIRGYIDGELKSMAVSKDFYDSFNYLLNQPETSERAKGVTAFAKGVKKYATNPIKALTTGYNPLFAITNTFRDAATYLVNTDSSWLTGAAFANIARAIHQISTNSELWNVYQAMGGGTAGFITGQLVKGDAPYIVGKAKNAVNAVGKVFSAAGSFSENTFRFAEFLNGIAKYGDTADGRAKAFAAAADVTVNFSQGGAVGKFADNFSIYLNPNLQGLDKMVRQIKNHPVKTLARTMSLGAIGLLVRYICNNDDNPHYQNLTEYVKDNYFCIPNVLGKHDENGYPVTFVKLPKSREYAVLVMGTMERVARMIDGESFDEAFADWGIDAFQSIAPKLNPLWNAALAPITNKNYYGGDIVPMYMQGDAAPEQTNDQTSAVSDLISKRLYEMAGVEVSPMVLDYMIEQYGGIYGQLFTSATAKDVPNAGVGLMNLLEDKFVVDPLYQSGVVSKFYDKVADAERLAYIAKEKREAIGGSVLSTDEQWVKKFESYKKQISTLRKKERELLLEYDDTPERKADIDALRTKINEIARTALDEYNERD